MLRLLLLLSLPVAAPALGGGGVGPAPPLEVWASEAPPSPQAASDTLEGIRRARELIVHHYRGARQSASARGNRAGGTLDRFCSGGEGSVCHGGDPDRGECNANVPCHPSEEWLVDGLAEVASENPSSGFLMGQAIYALTKFGRTSEAEALVRECRAESWWCQALFGYVLYSYAPLEMVEEKLRSAISLAPEGVRCRWGDAFWLLGDWDQRVGGREHLPPGREETAEWSCSARLAASDTIFWWADPLFSREGNDRWTVHMVRAVAGELSNDLLRTLRGSELPQEDRDRNWAMRIRRGPWDSYERLPGRGDARIWTSEGAARIHFVPDIRPGDFRNPSWRFDGDLQDEGYTPEEGPFFHISSQFARFRRGDSLLVVAAGGLENTRLRRAVDAVSHLVLSEEPERLLRHVRRDTRQATPVLQGLAPHLDYVASLEVETDIGTGVARELLPPLSPSGPEISDLLLYGTDGEMEAEELEDASGAMLGATGLEEGDLLGVFWEVYGVPDTATLSFELALERESGGLVERLTGLFPGGEEGDRGRVTWTEPAAGSVHSRGLNLNLSGLRSGAYYLVLSVRWPGQPPLQRRRALTVG